jgi:hypothetical protein
MSDIIRLAMQARDSATLVVDRHTNPNQKAASLALYEVMARCMELCERCDRDPAERAELEKLFAEQPKNGKRRYVEKGSDIYVFVCRYVFTDTDRTNAIRYAAALREASKMQISSADLAEHMKSRGGINALYFRRPLDARLVKTKCIRLAETITFSRDAPLTLRLSWRDDNSFVVLEQKGQTL